VPRRRVGEASTHKQPPMSAMESSSGAWPGPRVKGWDELTSVLFPLAPTIILTQALASPLDLT
jgi:hypothetical protein